MKTALPTLAAARRRTRARRPRTLAIDIGGTGLKALVLDARGAPLTDRVVVPTPRPATPRALLRAIETLVAPLGAYDRISAGFPGVVIGGVTKTAPNLHPSWAGFPLARTLSRRLGAPARVLNDAGVQGLGVIEGKDLELVLTLGTGLGSALFYEGVYVPNLELAHHPFRKGHTYEEYLGLRALRAVGKRRWNRRVARALAQIEPVWNPNRIYLGGGNARHLKLDLPPRVRIISNIAGLLGGIALWRKGHVRLLRRAPPPRGGAPARGLPRLEAGAPRERGRRSAAAVSPRAASRLPRCALR